MTAPKRLVGATALLIAMPVLSGCLGGPIKCETEGRYQQSRVGERIQVPEDLDELQSFKELTIPEASSEPERLDTGRCLELPPELGSSG